MFRQRKGRGIRPGCSSVQIVQDRRRVRKAVGDAAAQFCKLYPEWVEYFFDERFLLQKGMPIIERHIAHATARDAMDLALSWAEEWPPMDTNRRKARLQAVTLMAAALLQLVGKALMLPHPAVLRQVEPPRAQWQGIGIPLAYVQAHG
jgi:hypothetical protein